MPLSPIPAALEDLRQGKMIVVVDDEDRENEGDLVMAAERASPEAVNFMTKYGRGLICVPMSGERLDELKISMMVSDNTAPMGTAFTVTVDARRGVSTGTSAYDRAITIQALVDPGTRPEDLTRPGHILPAGVSASLEAGSPADAERILIGFISDALTAAMIEHDAELDMLAV